MMDAFMNYIESNKPQIDQTVKLTFSNLDHEQQEEEFRSIVAHWLRREGYTVPYNLFDAIEYTGFISGNDLNKLRAILDDKTGLTAAMYGVNLEDE